MRTNTTVYQIDIILPFSVIKHNKNSRINAIYIKINHGDARIHGICVGKAHIEKMALDSVALQISREGRRFPRKYLISVDVPHKLSAKRILCRAGGTFFQKRKIAAGHCPNRHCAGPRKTDRPKSPCFCQRERRRFGQDYEGSRQQDLRQ